MGIRRKKKGKVRRMKKLVYLLCAAMLMGLLAGCQTEPAGTQPPGGDVPTGNTQTTGTTAPQETEPVDIRPLPPENPGNSLIDYDPDRQIYITGENVYMDCYVDISGAYSFFLEIYSRQPLNTDEISVTFPEDLPGEVPFEVRVNPSTVERKTVVAWKEGMGSSSDYLPYHVYLAYRGETFEEGWEAFDADLINGSYEVQDSRGNFVSAADVLAGFYELKDGEEIEQRYRDFASLTEEDLPEFYVYSVVVSWIYVTELQETVVLDKLDLTIGDEVYEVKLGRVRILPPEAFPTETRVASDDFCLNNTIQPYNDGVFELPNVFNLEEAQEDITITGLRIAEEASRILDINVIMNSGGQYMEMQWDGKTPIYLFKGDSIRMNVFVKNEHAGKFLNYVVSHAIVEYTNSDNEQLCAVYSQVSSLNRPSDHENYAIIFDGVDMEPYYRNYYYKRTFHYVDEYRDK